MLNVDLEKFWRQSDGSYIEPARMHDNHIVNALTKASRWYCGQKYTIFQLDERGWGFILSTNPKLKVLVTEAIKRRLIRIQPPWVEHFPTHVAPLASARTGTDVSRCFQCDGTAITVTVRTLAHREKEESVTCNCGAGISARNAVMIWNAMYKIAESLR